VSDQAPIFYTRKHGFVQKAILDDLDRRTCGEIVVADIDRATVERIKEESGYYVTRDFLDLKGWLQAGLHVRILKSHHQRAGFMSRLSIERLEELLAAAEDTLETVAAEADLLAEELASRRTVRLVR
jgi:hypothetical protein